MKKTLLAILTVAVMAVTKVGALTVTVDYVTGYHAGSGGEFNVSPITGVGYAPVDLYNNNSGQLGFGTFCVDRDTPIVVPGQYTAVVNPNGITSSGNQISIGTAWLFQQFAYGTLAGYDYTPGAGRASSAFNLQLAIWTLEGTYNYQGNPNGGNIFLQKIEQLYGSIAAGSVDNNQQISVGVLLLTDPRTGQNAQPMLTLLPDGGSALILLGMALSSMAVVARKFRA